MEAMMDIPKLEVGLTVMIYKDPVTRTDKEGYAVLVEKIESDHRAFETPDGFEWWKVRFESGLDKDIYIRKISINK